jgi:hypothetical protein
LLIRDLMLVRDLSVRGPEDTPRFDYESATAVHASEDRDTHWVVGAVRASGGGFAADLRLLRPGQSQPAKIRVQQADFMNLAAQCAIEIAGAVGATVSPETIQMWRYGRPNSVEQIVRIGQLVLSDRESPQTSMAALALYQENPALSIAMDFVDSDYVPARRALLLESFHNDPYYAQTCFSLFIAIWDSTGPQPHAVQFLRRAIELSPGHGKAHMCAPHAASSGVNMLPHSDLGYRLLPKNTFAINNYILYLQLHGRPISQIIPLAYAGIEADPQDPGNYDRLMEMLAEAGDFQNALQVALALQKYYEPVMNPRTRYCLEQNPKMRELLRSGRFDPVDALRRKIGWLQGKV